MSPKIVDIDVSNASSQEHSPYIQRGLVLVAKIIQNLSNKVFFGKEAHLTVLNPFLEKNVQTINKFLSDTQVSPVRYTQYNGPIDTCYSFFRC